MSWWDLAYVPWFALLIYASAKGYIGRGWFYMPEQHCCHKEETK